MGKTISVEELLEKAHAYDGQVLSVEGQFIAMYDGAVICARREALELAPDRPRIKLEYANIEDPCFQVLSPYVGGSWYYHDPAIVSGRFFASPESRLEEISTLIIRRLGRDYRVDLQKGTSLSSES